MVLDSWAFLKPWSAGLETPPPMTLSSLNNLNCCTISLMRYFQQALPTAPPLRSPPGNHGHLAKNACVVPECYAERLSNGFSTSILDRLLTTLRVFIQEA
nr:unknown protein [synthetic construct]